MQRCQTPSQDLKYGTTHSTTPILVDERCSLWSAEPGLASHAQTTAVQVATNQSSSTGQLDNPAGTTARKKMILKSFFIATFLHAITDITILLFKIGC